MDIAIKNHFEKWAIKHYLKKWAMIIAIKAVYDRYLTLPLSPMGKDVLYSQITDLKRGIALAPGLELFFENLPLSAIVTFDLDETLKSLDCLDEWVSDHSSGFNDIFKEDGRSFLSASSTNVDRILDIMNDLFVILNKSTMEYGNDLARERRILLEIRSLYVDGMNVTAEQRHVDQEPKCSICLADFILAETVCKTPCNHLFHPQCITTWFEKQKTCPLKPCLFFKKVV